MPVRFQLTIDCADPHKLTHFWAEALGYQIEPAPQGFETWRDYYASVGVPPEELEDMGDGADSIIDPDGGGPRIWFQIVPEGKSIKNRLHLDITASGGRENPVAVRRERVDAEVERLLALGATVAYANAEPGMDHYGVTMFDPENNEFCIN